MLNVPIKPFHLPLYAENCLFEYIRLVRLRGREARSKGGADVIEGRGFRLCVNERKIRYVIEIFFA